MKRILMVVAILSPLLCNGMNNTGQIVPVNGLYQAVSQGNIEAVEKHLKKQPDSINAPLNRAGDTALGIAAHRGDDAMVNLLLKLEADISYANRLGRTALHLAAASHHKSVVKTLLDEENGECGTTSLCIACYFGFKDIASVLLEQDPDLVITEGLRVPRSVFKGPENENQKRDALLKGNEQFKDIWSSFKSGPLFWAIYGQQPELVTLLLPYLKKDLTDNIGDKQLALRGVQALPPLDNLLCLGTPIGLRNELCMTPLQVAAYLGNAKIASLLCAYGASVTTASIGGRSALGFAIESCSLATAQIVFAQCDDVNLNEASGETLLYLAVESGSPELVRFLLEKGADVTQRNREGLSPLDNVIIALKGSWDVPDEFFNLMDICLLLLNQGAPLKLWDLFYLATCRVPFIGEVYLREAAKRAICCPSKDAYDRVNTFILSTKQWKKTKRWIPHELLPLIFSSTADSAEYVVRGAAYKKSKICTIDDIIRRSRSFLSEEQLIEVFATICYESLHAIACYKDDNGKTVSEVALGHNNKIFAEFFNPEILKEALPYLIKCWFFTKSDDTSQSCVQLYGRGLRQSKED